MASGYPRDHGRIGSAIARCRKCDKRILWVTLSNGTRVPLDPHPDPEGIVLVLAHGATWRLGMRFQDTALASEARNHGYPLHTFHQDTCASRRPRQRADLA